MDILSNKGSRGQGFEPACMPAGRDSREQVKIKNLFESVLLSIICVINVFHLNV
jgi:hypothetical protein